MDPTRKAGIFDSLLLWRNLLEKLCCGNDKSDKSDDKSSGTKCDFGGHQWSCSKKHHIVCVEVQGTYLMPK